MSEGNLARCGIWRNNGIWLLFCRLPFLFFANLLPIKKRLLAAAKWWRASLSSPNGARRATRALIDTRSRPDAQQVRSGSECERRYRRELNGDLRRHLLAMLLIVLIGVTGEIESPRPRRHLRPSCLSCRRRKSSLCVVCSNEFSIGNRLNFLRFPFEVRRLGPSSALALRGSLLRRHCVLAVLGGGRRRLPSPANFASARENRRRQFSNSRTLSNSTFCRQPPHSGRSTACSPLPPIRLFSLPQRCIFVNEAHTRQ